MLHKSFKPAKCKTSLRLATSRIKLMKNKKGVQINQMKKDLAHLLETSQDRTARIRVEHVIREEKMVAAYDLIEIYCELIVARLPIIESQKTCPIDLKEAITSVIFAAPRCSDISELADIKKQFAAKYGKEFVTAAIELRPDCGVNRMLVEKLSAVAPNLETKIKVLSDVAKEHNIEWDSTSIEEKESKPSNDLLNGPPKFENANIENTDPPKVQPSNINAVHGHGEKPILPADFSEQNRRYTLGTQNIISTDNSGETSSSATHADMRSSGPSSERIETRQPIRRGDDDYLSGRQNWNMEFKDATAAAHAAAESAERAAMAARAAAQFSSREKRAYHHPTVSHLSNDRDQTRHVSDSSGSIGESSLDDRKPKLPNRHIDRSEPDTSQKATEKFDGRNIRSSEPTFSKSNNEPVVDDNVVNDFNMAGGYFEESLNVNEEGPASSEMTTHEEFRESETESGNFEYESINFFAEEATKKQPSMRSSHSRSSTASGEHDVAGHQKDSKRSVVGNPFAVVDQGSPFRESMKTSSSLDDEAISDNEGRPTFDTGFEYDDMEAIHSLENAHIWSPRRSNSNKVDQQSQPHLFSESRSFRDHSVKKSVDPSETDEYVPASFDHSDGPDSESESELPMNPEPSFVESSEKFNSRKSRIELNELVEGESSLYNSDDEEKRPESQHESKKHNLNQNIYNDTLEDDNDSLNQPDDLGSSKELNFEALTGGLRHKGGLRYPPLTTTEESYLSKKSLDESSIIGGQTSLQSSLDSKANLAEDEKPSISISSSDSDSERSSKQANTKPRFSPAPFFGDDETDTEEEVLKQVPSRIRFGAGLSRRTRGSPSASYSKTHVEVKPEASTVIPSQDSYSDEFPGEPRGYAGRLREDTKQIPESQQHLSSSRKTVETGQTKSTTSDPRVDQYSRIKPTTSEPRVDKYSRIKPKTSEPRVNQYSWIKPNTSEAQVNLSVNTKQEPVETRPKPKIPTREPRPVRTDVELDNSKKTKTPNLGPERSSGEILAKKPSHVHPKLPDYESLAARLQSMRTDHQ